MQILVNLTNNRIEGFCENGSMDAADGFRVVDIEKNLNTGKLMLSTYENGEIVYHEEFLQEQQKKEEIAKAIEEQEVLFSHIQRKASLRSLDDSQAFSVRLLYEEWQSGVEYEKGDRVIFEDKFYKCISEEKHISNDTLKPNLANYLWVEIADPNVEYPEWKQPLGYADAYGKGDKVTFEGKKYISLIDGNTYSPAAYPAGWQEVK